MNHKDVKFPNEASSEFVKTLKSRVRDYFKENNISRYGNSEMVLKSIAMISMFFVPYFIMVLGVVTSPWAITAMWLAMGVGMAGIGLSIMHDANHGAYSKNKTVNNLMGWMLDVVGGNASNWKIQHNVLHHTYTNVSGVDEDISPPKFMRFSPHEPLMKVHKYQHFYAWFFYGLMTFGWIVAKDYKQLIRYRKKGFIKGDNKSFNMILLKVTIAKILYYTYIIAIPILVLPSPWWMTLINFFLMHFVAGLILGMIFQPAHVMPSSEYPLPDEKGNLENYWAIHQLLTTTNFAPKNKIFSWYVGGLNYQVEHHLFPNICHVHYRKISGIVEQTAKEYGFPYHSVPTFSGALYQHGKMLKLLGNNELKHLKGLQLH
ncbi:acyl-CoA desaturase [Flammeovirgaceae bacterium SG7u.111]|nr:acyl-CoA desaturase [Flammeovirgaceae bacterium SG7u.132]WPO33413.1 acyl-CoA desaturase [Flammeovirgaceae bacterium SG7u.111]